MTTDETEEPMHVWIPGAPDDLARQLAPIFVLRPGDLDDDELGATHAGFYVHPAEDFVACLQRLPDVALDDLLSLVSEEFKRRADDGSDRLHVVDPDA